MKEQINKVVQSYAFTLAEVLITLGIIGIVAAMTIPSLIANTQKGAYASGAIKYQSVFQNAIAKYMADNSYGNLLQSDLFNNGGASAAGTQKVWDALKTYFILSKDCVMAVGQGCFPSNLKFLNNTDVAGPNKNPDTYSDFAKGIFNDGAMIYLYDEGGNCNTDRSISHTGELLTECGYMFIDVNGMKSPNKYGRDIFIYWILANGKITPGGSSDDYGKGCDSTSADTAVGNDGSAGTGMGCTYEVIMNKAMNY